MCTYAFLPHLGSLSAENVICPAYLLNEKPVIVEGALPMESLLRVGSDHVIVETVKPAESKGEDSSGEKSFVLRLYEAEGSGETVSLAFGIPVKGAAVTDMLEEVQEEYGPVQQLALDFRAFEIKTVKVWY